MKKNWLKFGIFALILSAVLVLLDIFVFVETKYETPYGRFYAEAENSLDLVCIGNSTVREGIIPLEAWGNFGITGYNITAYPTHPEVILIAIDEVMRLQKAKVIYIDINGLTYQKEIDQQTFVKDYYNAMPDGEAKEKIKNKYEYLNINENKIFEPFENHNEFRNQEYFLKLISDNQAYLKGYTPKFARYSQKVQKLDNNSILELPEDGKKYLNKILEECKKYENTNFIFGKMPRFINENNSNETYMLRSAIPLIEENGYTYVEWEKYNEQIGLDCNSDMSDLNHLNFYGAKKFTNFFIDYLDEMFNIANTIHDESTAKNFNECYEKYLKKYGNKS